jgi:short-subunit dehydrogenase
MNGLTACLRMELRAAHPGLHVSAVHPGIVATDFGKNALHGGRDSREFAGAQSAEEVAEVIASVIESPRADVYTRAAAQQLITSYYASEDMAAAEEKFMLR